LPEIAPTQRSPYASPPAAAPRHDERKDAAKNRQETDCYRAKLRAARQIIGGWARPLDLPTDQEIRDEVLAWSRMFDGSQPAERLARRGAAEPLDRFLLYEMLLWPLEHIKQNPKWHPEGDALYHSLQVFELARDALPYDEEFLLAALLHDVGKAIDPHDRVATGLAALEGYISERTAWLIASHEDAAALRAGTLGARGRRRLREHESFEELELLAQCDRRGRQCGAPAPEVHEALDYVRDLAAMCG
jgi:hypothetical protein